MKASLVTLLSVGALFCHGQLARAQIVAPAGRTLFNQGVMLRSFVRLDNFDESAPGLQVRRFTNPYALVWGTYPHLSLSFVTPFIVLDQDSPNPASDMTTRGTGDLSVFARYDVFQKTVPAGYTRLSPEFGVKFPTGNTFSTGSTDYTGTLVFSHVRDPHWLVTDIQFRYNTTGDNDLRIGNIWRYDVAYLYRLLPRDSIGIPGLMLDFELNGLSTDRSEVNGISKPDSGGNLLFFTAGIEYFPSRRIILELAISMRIHENLNGSQDRPTSSFILGFRWLM